MDRRPHLAVATLRMAMGIAAGVATNVTMGLALSVAALSLPATAQAAEPAAAQRFPDVVGVQVRPRGAAVFDFDVTVSSPYDTPQRYADAFRVTHADGTVYGERILWHDHAGEQPFTRDLHGVKIPPGVTQVQVQARDQRHGYGGKAATVKLPGR